MQLVLSVMCRDLFIIVDYDAPSSFSFDPLMMGRFVNVQLLGRSRCISSHFRGLKFQPFPGGACSRHPTR